MASPKERKRYPAASAVAYSSRQRGPMNVDHQQQRRARQMEVGEQHVDQLPLERPVDEQPCAPCRSATGGGLERPRGRRPDRDGATGRRAGGEDRGSTAYRSLWIRCWVGSASLIGWNVSRPTTSSIRATSMRMVQQVEDRGREVQARRRRGGGTRLGRVHGLVALGVGQRRGDVRRERHLAVTDEYGQRLVAEQRDHERVTRLGAASDLRDRSAVERPEHLSRWRRRAGRTSASTSCPNPDGLQEEDLGGPAARPRTRSRAGITFESLTTTRSPGSKQWRSRTCVPR